MKRAPNFEDVGIAILTLLAKRSQATSICPSEVARLIASRKQDWRSLMPVVRAVAVQLAKQDVLRITRGSMSIDPEELGAGPIRIRRGVRWNDE
jgi:hypothetical protein